MGRVREISYPPLQGTEGISYRFPIREEGAKDPKTVGLDGETPERFSHGELLPFGGDWNGGIVHRGGGESKGTSFDR